MVDRRDDDDRVEPVYGTDRVPPVEHDRKRGGALWWLLAALAAILLLVLLTRGCDDTRRTDAVAPVETGSAAGRVSDAGDPMVSEAAAYSTAEFDRYLAGTEPVGRAFALDKVTFASGSDTLDAVGRKELDELAGVLKRYPNAAIALTGYADPEGDAAANEALSRRRAEAVRAALAKAGVAARSVSLAGEGETGTAAVRDNRKVEVRVTAR